MGVLFSQAALNIRDWGAVFCIRALQYLVVQVGSPVQGFVAVLGSERGCRGHHVLSWACVPFPSLSLLDRCPPSVPLPTSPLLPPPPPSDIFLGAAGGLCWQNLAQAAV